MHYVERKRGLCLLVTAMILAVAGCGGKADEITGEPALNNEAEPAKKPGTPGIDEQKTVDVAKEIFPTAVPLAVFETSDFFKFPDAAIVPLLKEKQDSQHFTFFRSAGVDEMEFAVLDCLFLAESAFDSNYLPAAEQFLTYFPELTWETKLFLRRMKGAQFWEAVVLEYVSDAKNGSYSDPYIAFNSKENGMIMFGAEYMYIYVTEDGGITWVPAADIPSPTQTVVGSARCMTGCGENRFLIGHRYKGTPETGQLSLTEDNGKTWKKIELPATETDGLKYCYSEPVEFRKEEDGTLFLKMCAREEESDTEVKDGRDDVYYELLSVDGGLTWELAQPQP